jgi:hypothetical protein
VKENPAEMPHGSTVELMANVKEKVEAQRTKTKFVNEEIQSARM